MALIPTRASRARRSTRPRSSAFTFGFIAFVAISLVLLGVYYRHADVGAAPRPPRPFPAPRLETHSGQTLDALRKSRARARSRVHGGRSRAWAGRAFPSRERWRSSRRGHQSLRSARCALKSCERRAMRAFLAVLALPFDVLSLRRPAAALTEAELSDVALRPGVGAVAPADIAFTDDDGRAVALGDVTGGRATLLILADYNCHTICGPILGVAATAIREPRPRRRSRFQSCRRRHRSSSDARRRRSHEGGPIRRRSRSRAGPFSRWRRARDRKTFRGDRLPRALRRRDAPIRPPDRHARPDARSAHFAPVAGLAVSGGDELRFALVEAGGGLVASLIDRAHVLCYGLDPAHGVYNSAVRATLDRRGRRDARGCLRDRGDSAAPPPAASRRATVDDAPSVSFPSRPPPRPPTPTSSISG